MARGSWSSCWLSGFTLSPGGRGRRKDFEEEFLIELRDFSADGLSEKLIGGGGEDAELEKHGGVHFLSFIDEQDWPMEAGAEILEPLVAQSFEAAPAIVRRERNSEEIAEFAIEVTEVALGSDDDADGNVGDLREFSSGDSESDGFTRSGFAGDKGEPSVTNLVLQTPAKVLDLGVDPEGVVRQFGGK